MNIADGPDGWGPINRSLLPAAEWRGSHLVLPSQSRNIGVLGAYRSGTTWLANLLAEGTGAHRLFEKAGALCLLGRRRIEPGRATYLWQGTFLGPCERLVTAFARETATVLILRDPADVVRSMVHGWAGLDDVCALTSAVGRTHPSGDAVDRAIDVLDGLLELLGDVLAAGLIDAVTTFEDVARDPQSEVERIAAIVGVPCGRAVRDPQRKGHHVERLPAAAEELIEARLGGSYRRLLVAARSRPPSRPG